ncbi:MAG: PP2C family protein-serine/threonine phosphatase [Vulcanimicrobiota bacterium]
MGTCAETTRERILVVDDAPEVRLLLRGVLEAEGYQVDLTACGVEAVTQLARQSADLILLDLDLPDTQGVALCQQLRQQGFERPIIMLTSHNQLTDRTAGLESGADDYIAKPFAPEELVARIKAQLRREQRFAVRVEELLAERWERIHEGLALTRQIQQPFGAGATLPGVSTAVRHLPVGRIGGDFFLLEESSPDTFTVIIGDTMGKGVGASLVMAWTLATLHRLAHQLDSPAEILQRANRELGPDLEGVGIFVAAFCGVFHRQTGLFTYSTAGCEPPILIRANPRGRRHERLMTKGMPIGILADFEYAEASLEPGPADRLFLYTDGLIESVDADQQPQLLRSLYRLLLESMHRPVDSQPDLLMQRLRLLTNNQLFLSDDLTFMLLEFPEPVLPA